MALSELLSESVLDRLTMSDDLPMRVELGTCYSLGGNFICTGAAVTWIAPNNLYGLFLQVVGNSFSIPSTERLHSYIRPDVGAITS